MNFGYDYADYDPEVDDLRAEVLAQRRFNQRLSLHPLDPEYPDLPDDESEEGQEEEYAGSSMRMC